MTGAVQMMIMLFMKYDQTLRTDSSWSLILDSTGPGISKAAFQAFFPGIAREENFLGSWRVCHFPSQMAVLCRVSGFLDLYLGSQQQAPPSHQTHFCADCAGSSHNPLDPQDFIAA